MYCTVYSLTVSHQISGPHCQAKFVTSAIVVFYPWWITMADGHFSSFWCSLCCVVGVEIVPAATAPADMTRTESTPTTLTDWLGYWKPITATIFLTWGELIFNLNSGSFCRIKQGTEKKYIWINICSIFWQWGCQSAVWTLSVRHLTLVCDDKEHWDTCRAWNLDERS